MNAIILLVAILCEIVGTTALKSSAGFTRLTPSLLTVVAYALAFYFLAQPLRTMPVGLVYAIWSGAGIVILATIDRLWFRQPIDAAGLVGIGLILAGVLVINLLSRSVGH
ncbi:DMT family transporter [Mangrovibrevibacter kandeliae]|uniref:DMT family transporter n=1 Tax=Mangrovibrevibacter kandeliae TaxID=2968473 RepID=UPI0021185E8C|nr:multidrug efflux SMR transporter [Aurantimonas sp. MSK8Z-1]MCQ8781108.1 multidrug efflux SMR transporter [Aurantimonas sp. CSK15Z-1]MCW4113889.1 multidrug efflux SMR transporter [Aurantimonas sp. MSK8Z-1]